MRIVRGFFGTLLLLVAGILGGFAAFEGGMTDSWRAFRLDRMLHRGLVWAAGCVVVALLAMALARTGTSAGKGLIGRLLAVIAVAVSIQALVVANKHPMDSLVFAVPALILAIAAAVFLALRSA